MFFIYPLYCTILRYSPPPNLLVCRKFENIRTKELVKTKNINTQKFAVTEVGTNTENVK